MAELNRRGVLTGLAGVAAGLPLAAEARAAQGGRRAEQGPIRVVIWDERQPIQKQAYENFLGNAIADYLKGKDGLAVRSVGMDDPEQGLPKPVLDECDVLFWWGHARHREVKPELAADIVRRVKAGQLSLIALHSAHFARPFMEAMNARTLEDVLSTLAPAEWRNLEIRTIPPKGGLQPKDGPLTPSFTKTEGPEGKVVLEIKLPACVFYGVRNDGKPSHVKILRTDHPLARGVPTTFDIPQTEMYPAPFHVPTPDLVLMEERWDLGETFPGCCYWTLGRGNVLYFRPGHETYPIFKQPEVLRIMENAARWMPTQKAG